MTGMSPRWLSGIPAIVGYKHVHVSLTSAAATAVYTCPTGVKALVCGQYGFINTSASSTSVTCWVDQTGAAAAQANKYYTNSAVAVSGGHVVNNGGAVLSAGGKIYAAASVLSGVVFYANVLEMAPDAPIVGFQAGAINSTVQVTPYVVPNGRWAQPLFDFTICYGGNLYNDNAGAAQLNCYHSGFGTTIMATPTPAANSAKSLDSWAWPPVVNGQSYLFKANAALTNGVNLWGVLVEGPLG